MSDSETTTLKMIQEFSRTQQKINSSLNARLEVLETDNSRLKERIIALESNQGS